MVEGVRNDLIVPLLGMDIGREPMAGGAVLFEKVTGG
jgi:hypothetical protein